ncbi:hypothetical protein [Gimesia aquarii]|uniref:Uncharacterized protein n=1 Tax=Gimesia aquarii TaxID=2527964 RepID=A0A517X0M4_9PLAN|nr:hypothetical protein [Gimesia aquarii]QDU11042.1 hypothetical protein V202x_44580 [Gimesia aquarii]
MFRDNVNFVHNGIEITVLNKYIRSFSEAFDNQNQRKGILIMYTFKIGGFCLLLTSFIAVTVYWSLGVLDIRTLYGAGLTAAENCKEPCSDTGLTSVIECADYKGEVGQCELDKCFLNTVRLLKCTPPPGPAGSGNQACQWGEDPLDWQRWIIEREDDCTDGGPNTDTFGVCEGSPYSAAYTPCTTSSCTGTLIADQAWELDRPICGTPGTPIP